MTHSKLAPNNGNRTHSAEKLGISVRALQKKIALLRIRDRTEGVIHRWPQMAADEEEKNR